MKTIRKDAGFCKMYWDLFNDEELSINDIVTLCYILDKYDIFREKKEIDNVEYKRISESFIQQRLQTHQSTISTTLKKLNRLGYISIYQKTLKSPIWIHVSNELLNSLKDNDKDDVKVNVKENHQDNVKENPYQIINKTQDSKNKTQEEDDDVSSSSSEQLSKYQPLYDKFRQVLGGGIYSIDNIYQYASPLIQREYTIQDLADVIECKAKEWKGTEFFQYIRPQTLFGKKFEEYLAQSKVMLAHLSEEEKTEKEAERIRKLAEDICNGDVVIDNSPDQIETVVDDMLQQKGWSLAQSSKASLVNRLKDTKQTEDNIRTMFSDSSTLLDIYKKIS